MGGLCEVVLLNQPFLLELIITVTAPRVALPGVGIIAEAGQHQGAENRADHNPGDSSAAEGRRRRGGGCGCLHVGDVGGRDGHGDGRVPVEKHPRAALRMHQG